MTAAPHRPLALAWLDLARAGNFPSVASNVMAAFVLSAAAPLQGGQLAGALAALAAAHGGRPA